MRLLALVGALMLVTLLPTASASAAGQVVVEETWLAGNGNTYVVVSLPDSSWDEAAADVNVLGDGAHLVTVASQEESDFVIALVAAAQLGPVWFGGFQDPDSEVDPAAGWTWVTGEDWGFTNWADGEPNDGGRPADEQHLVLEGSEWNDVNRMNRQSGYVAEIEATDPPAMCDGEAATIVGTDGDEVLKGTRKRDVIVAFGGNDTIYGLGGDDLICAGDGDDNVYAGWGDDVVFAGAGNDRVRGGGGDDTIHGDAGRDKLLGQSGDDSLDGGADPDLLKGADGRDRLWAHDGGKDWVIGGSGRDFAEIDRGIDRLRSVEATSEGEVVNQFTGTVFQWSPCNTEYIEGSVTTTLTYREITTRRGVGAHVTVRLVGDDVPGSFGNHYDVTVSASAWFNSLGSPYVFAGEVFEYLGEDGAPSFHGGNEVHTVVVDGGFPISHQFSSGATVCDT